MAFGSTIISPKISRIGAGMYPERMRKIRAQILTLLPSRAIIALEVSLLLLNNELLTNGVLTNGPRYICVRVSGALYCCVWTRGSKYCCVWTRGARYCCVWIRGALYWYALARGALYCCVWGRGALYRCVWARGTLYCCVWASGTPYGDVRICGALPSTKPTRSYSSLEWSAARTWNGIKIICNNGKLLLPHFWSVERYSMNNYCNISIIKNATHDELLPSLW